jgi:UTP--glucose-1-phosphate uridylyltransferase
MTNQSVPKYRPIRKAVLPVAGLGTRFLPATKAVPKEMLNIVDRPMIQYIVDEALSAGIEHIVFVTGRNKQIIEDYFDLAYELNDTLVRRGKVEALTILQTLQPAAGAMSFTRQQEPLGLGHAVWCARDIIGNEPFALLLPDMITSGDMPCMKSMVELYNETGGNIVAVQTCDPEETHKYGIVGMGKPAAGGFEISEMVEKPAKGTSPSNLYINGRYILQPEIFGHLAKQERGAGGEIQLTDSMLTLSKSQTFYGYVFEGETFDCGSKEGFIEANIAMALGRDDMRATTLKIIEDRAGSSAGSSGRAAKWSYPIRAAGQS